jgi:hypothetical protein
MRLSCPLTFVLAIACVIRGGSAFAAPGDGLPGSAHDFRNVRASAAKAGELCSVCHVPRTNASTRLLWDPAVERDSASRRSSRHAKDTSNGPSARCLSCHDGTVANGDAGADRESHPVPMPYPYGSIANTYSGLRNGQLLATSEWVADPSNHNIRLYSEDGHGNVVTGPRYGATGIECSSCHDPHNKAARDQHLLRAKTSGTQASGYLCVQCHARS